MRHLSRLGCIAGLALALALALLGCAPAAAGQCRIERFPAIAVTMKGLRPMVWAGINGHRARFFIDTGAFWSMLSPAAQTEYHLSEQMAPEGFSVQGVNGSTIVDIATVGIFTFLKVPFHDMQFLVGGNDYPSGAVGALGENVLRMADVEYDFADGVMRFVKTRHCGDLPLAYWAEHQDIGVVDLEDTTAVHPQLVAHATVNGKRIRVLFDTGAPRSMLTLYGAKRIGITPSSPGVKLLGRFPGGIAQNWMKVWIAPVALFEIGGEKIEHTHLLIGQTRWLGRGVDMFLGADFFLSHHIYVANSRHKLYFTYNGGPVFDLGKRYWIKRGNAAPVLAGTGAAPQPAPATARSAKALDTGAPMSPAHPGGRAGGAADGAAAAELMRRGMAYASEGQYASALDELNRACRLEPRNAEYLFRRGKVYRADKQPAKALADFNAAIALKSDLFRAHLARAWLVLGWKHAPADAASRAKSDANIVELLAPDQSELRLPLARLYGRMGRYASAIREVDLWIYYHGDDALLPVAWNARCRSRAQADRDLHKALEDCDRALARLPKTAAVRDSRGLVYLRLGRLRRAIADYDAALKLNPKLATSLYGRGLAELREGRGVSGRSDLAAAARLDHGVAGRFARMGLAP